MDGVLVEVTTPITCVVSINMHDASHAGLPKVDIHPVASALTWQLFKLPEGMFSRTVYMNLLQVQHSLLHIFHCMLRPPTLCQVMINPL
jgi:hypothetical protein